MPEIRPFPAVRYDPAVAGDPRLLVSPPYDVVSPPQQRALYDKSPYNVIRVELTASEPGDPPGDAARHLRACATLDDWMATGVLRRDPAPAVYLYEQRFDNAGQSYARRSLLVAARLYPWSAGEVLPHEHTLARPKAERLALLRATRANISPLWALYEDRSTRVAAILGAASEAQPATALIDDEGVSHRLWPIVEPGSIAAISAEIAGGPLYMADGHHRYETALAYQAEAPDDAARGYVLMALTAAGDPGLIVLPTHRLLSSLPAERLTGLAERLARFFDVEVLALPESGAGAWLERLLPSPTVHDAAHRFALLGPEVGTLRLLRLRNPARAGTAPTAALADLDVWLAHRLILEDCLGIDAASLSRQDHVTYTRDAAEAIEAVQGGAQQLALFLAPTPVSQLLEVAREGGVMPQKSTYFFPKLATGLVIRLVE